MYKFSGKPAGTLSLIPGRYVRLDVAKVRPRFRRKVTHMLYLNVAHYVPLREGLPGRIRVRIIRGAWKGKPEDPSAYKDILLAHGFSDWLETHTYWELAERGRPCWWEIKAEHVVADIGTRYAKADPV